MPRARRVDENQEAVVDAFRQAGARVRVCSEIGKGHPDLIVVWDGWNPPTRYVEVKGPKGKLTKAQREWIAETGITPTIVRSPLEALSVMGFKAEQISRESRHPAQTGMTR